MDQSFELTTHSSPQPQSPPPPLVPQFWTNLLTDKVLSLLRTGSSYAQAAKAVGVSRSAIAGRIKRMRDAGQLPDVCRAPEEQAQRAENARIRKEKQAAARAALRPAKKAKMLPKSPQPIPEWQCGVRSDIEPVLVDMWELRPHHCRYPYGGGIGSKEGEFLFCGHVKLEDQPYCRGHMGLTRVPPPPSREIQRLTSQYAGGPFVR